MPKQMAIVVGGARFRKFSVFISGAARLAGTLGILT